MNIKKFTKLSRLVTNNFEIHTVRRDPVHKTLHVTVSYSGPEAGKMKFTKGQKDTFYKEQAKEMIDPLLMLMSKLKPRCKTLKLHVR